VVERILGKAEVDSSILSGGTILPLEPAKKFPFRGPALFVEGGRLLREHAGNLSLILGVFGEAPSRIL
jgi:hypothetical protein